MSPTEQIIDITEITKLEKSAKTLAKHIRGDEVFALIGDLGAGKTTFSKLFLKSAGVTKTVTSPTFILMAPYDKGSRTYYHLDLYRLNSYKEARALGLEELWGKKDNVFLIEWADKIKSYLPKSTIELYFSIEPTGKRFLQIINAPEYLKI
jgi:tRNA threonylcarbamoyladenosine biosynthesis protein TsaE